MHKPKYANVASTVQNLEIKQQQSNQLVKTLLRQQNSPADDKEKIERQERTCIIRKPKDPNIRDARDIRRVIYNKYKDANISKARNCAGGSILLEFDDAPSAQKMIDQWDKTLFGGNEGIVKHQPRHTAGLIKQVEYLSEEEITKEIKENYQDVHVELFKRQGRFIGTVKITFKDEASLKTAIQNNSSG